jgi:preprotein translocase subunit Sec61beta
MVEERISMPSSQGGLVRYFSEYKSKIQIKPIHVVYFVIGVIVIELALKIFKSG